MKKVFVLLLALLLMSACNSATEKKEQAAAEQEAPAAEWVEVTLDVEGMTCDGCENAIKAGVENLEGIAEVESSHEEGWTRVKYDKNQTSVDDIQARITETGYEVKGEL
ncbi:MAG: cation transporter [Bacteroidales bacterium]|nr:cation transporter [Bacteroidales bacterium]